MKFRLTTLLMTFFAHAAHAAVIVNPSEPGRALRVPRSADGRIHFAECRKRACAPIGDESGYSVEDVESRLARLQQEKSAQIRINVAILAAGTVSGALFARVVTYVPGYDDAQIFWTSLSSGALIGYAASFGIVVLRRMLENPYHLAEETLSRGRDLAPDRGVYSVDTPLSALIEALNYALME